MENIKLCKDCKWVKRDWFFLGSYECAKCNRPSFAIMISYVIDGSFKKRSCNHERMGLYKDSCGMIGKYWEHKNGQNTNN